MKGVSLALQPALYEVMSFKNVLGVPGLPGLPSQALPSQLFGLLGPGLFPAHCEPGRPLSVSEWSRTLLSSLLGLPEGCHGFEGIVQII